MKIYKIEINGKSFDIIQDVDGKFIKPEIDGGTALKPAAEYIVMARKPLSEKTIVDNVIKWGTGGINVDGCRIGTDSISSGKSKVVGGGQLNCENTRVDIEETFNEGRFPANIIFDELAADMLDEQTGILNKQGKCKSDNKSGWQNDYVGGNGVNPVERKLYLNDQGGASRFFFKVMDETNIEKKDITNKTLCGTITEKKKVDGILDGVKMEIEKYILNANQFISGNKEMENYQVDMRYTISILIKLMTELKTYNVLKEQNIEDYTQNLIKTILLLMEKSIEDAKNVESIKNYMTSIKLIESMLDMEVIVNVVQENTYKNGELKIENTITNTTENIGSNYRFQYIPKVSKKERNMGLDGFEDKIIEGRDAGQDELNVAYKKRPTPQKNTHPTLKPINLMTYLCRLVTPPGGIVLDPFMGSGSTGISALLEGFRFVGMEQDQSYFEIANARIEAYEEYRSLLKK